MAFLDELLKRLGQASLGPVGTIPQMIADRNKPIQNPAIQSIASRFANNVPAPTQQVAPMAQPVQEEITPEVPNKFLQFFKNNRQAILQALPAIISTGVGVASDKALPGAAGFSAGYSSQLMKEREKAQERADSLLKTEEDKWNDAYDTAIRITKSDLGAVTPQEIDTAAKTVYMLKNKKGKVGETKTNQTSNLKQSKEQMILEYQTTNDPERIKQLETELTKLGVKFK